MFWIFELLYKSGLTSFDNFGAAILQVFITITLEGWAAIMYKLQDAQSNWVWIYFVLLIFINAFFAVNLCLAVIESVYSQQMKLKRNY